MNAVISQIRRVFNDDGRNDKDFTVEELKLKEARDRLNQAIDEMKAAANHLFDALAKLN